jgi:hypothetical protein
VIAETSARRRPEVFFMLARSFETTRSLGLLLCGVVALTGTSFAQVTTSNLTIGGIGAFGCTVPGGPAPQDPPVLENGQVGSGSVAFQYDGATQILTLVVSNTSPVVPGWQNPVIRRVYVNLPPLACTGAVLLSQTGSDGQPPNFEFHFDVDITDNVNPLNAECFGHFGIRLRDPGTIAGSIANPLATDLPGPPGSMCIGPVTFQIQILGASDAVTTLIASSYSSSLSFNPGGQYVNSVFQFAPGASIVDDVSQNFISSTPVAGGGSTAGWMVGTPETGENVTLVMAGTPTWFGLMVASLDPGPIWRAGILFPIGEVYFEVMNGILPSTGFQTETLVIPGPQEAPELGGLTVYGLVVAASPDLRTISVSEQFAVFVEF